MYPARSLINIKLFSTILFSVLQKLPSCGRVDIQKKLLNVISFFTSFPKMFIFLTCFIFSFSLWEIILRIFGNEIRDKIRTGTCCKPSKFEKFFVNRRLLQTRFLVTLVITYSNYEKNVDIKFYINNQRL